MARCPSPRRGTPGARRHRDADLLARTAGGFFGIGARPPRRFDEQDVETLGLFARHAAIAIENARRYELREAPHRTTRPDRPGRTDHHRRSGAERTAADHRRRHPRTAGLPNIAIPLIDPQDPGTLVIRHMGGRYKHLVRPSIACPISRGIMGAAVRERRMQLVNDVEADPRYVQTPGAGIHTELAVPILLGERRPWRAQCRELGALHRRGRDEPADHRGPPCGCDQERPAVRSRPAPGGVSKSGSALPATSTTR